MSYSRIDLICKDGHKNLDVFLAIPREGKIRYPKCACGKKTEQLFANRKPSEGYAVVNGANW